MIQQHLDKIREIVNTDIDPALWEICQGILREVRAIETMVKEQKPVAWMYNRVGSEFNPCFIAAGQEADSLRLGRPPLMNPSSAHVDWTPLCTAAASARQKSNESRPKTCPNKFRPDGTYSGCQLHNLHCAYPNCEK